MKMPGCMNRRSFLIGSTAAVGIAAVSTEALVELQRAAGRRTYVDYGRLQHITHVHQLSRVHIVDDTVMRHADRFVLFARAGDKIGNTTVIRDGLYMRSVVQQNNEIVYDNIVQILR